MKETVKNTTIVELPNIGAYGLGTDPYSTIKKVESFTKDLEGSWFKNTWDDYGRTRAVQLFPYKLLQVKGDQNVASFTLPISPQQLNISTPFAVVVTPTLNGIVEEHNSVRFKDIEIAGTMGVFPADRNATPDPLGLLKIFDPTGIADTVDSSVSGIPLLQILSSRPELIVPQNANSGYANLHRLRIFLESYAEKKKTDKDLRLVFASYKDNQFYYTTPTAFTVRRSASSPLEYEYSLALRSWGTFDPNVNVEIEYEHSGINMSAAVLLGLTSVAALPKALGAIGKTSKATIDAIKALGNSEDASDFIVNLLETPFLDNLFGTREWEKFINFAARNDTNGITLVELNKISGDTASASSAISESLGLSPQTNVNVVPQTQYPSPEQLNVLFSLNSLKINLDHAKAALMMTAPQQVSPLDYVAGLASKSGIAFQTATSKYPVSFPAGATLERFSARYLGDPNRWMEIATLNGLQSPYVDNTGYDIPLSFDGDKNKVVIQGTRLDLGRYVTLSSTTQPRKTYGVLSTVKNGDYYEITLDNDYNNKLKNTNTPDNLSRYTKADLASLHFYTPNTVHAGQILYVPSDEPSPINGFNSSAIPSLKQYEDEIRVSGVDLMLTETDGTGNTAVGALDLVIQENDVKLAYGLTNIKQCLNLILFTPQGSLLQHPTFGLGTPVGTSNADINYQDFEQAIRTAILNDRTFSDVEFVTTSLNKSVLTVSVGVRVAQLNKVLPVAFDINLRGA